MNKEYSITSFDEKTDLVWFVEQETAENFIMFLDTIEPTKKHTLTQNVCVQGNFYVKLPKENAQNFVNDFFIDSVEPKLTQETMEYFANKAVLKTKSVESKNIPEILKNEFKALFCYLGYKSGDDIQVYNQENKKWEDGKIVAINNSWDCKIGDKIVVTQETPYFFLNFLVVTDVQSSNPIAKTIINPSYIKKKS